MVSHSHTSHDQMWGDSPRAPTMRSPTDVTDAQGALLQPMRPEGPWRPGGPGRPPCDVRRLLNGILDLNKTGRPMASGPA